MAKEGFVGGGRGGGAIVQYILPFAFPGKKVFLLWGCWRNGDRSQEIRALPFFYRPPYRDSGVSGYFETPHVEILLGNFV